MDVVIDKTRHEHAAGEVDHAGRGTGESPDLFAAADGHDAAVLYGKGLGFGHGLIHGPDPSVQKNQIRSCRFLRLDAGRDEEHRQGEGQIKAAAMQQPFLYDHHASLFT
jgi:ABC-type nitrate/sulfonate/bicarbonate transport system substrate-binding protein